MWQSAHATPERAWTPRVHMLQLPNAPTQEGNPAVDEDCGAEQCGNPTGAGERRCRVTERPLKHVSPDERGEREEERDPKPVAEHRDGVSGMAVVPAVCITRCRVLLMRVRPVLGG